VWYEIKIFIIPLHFCHNYYDIYNIFSIVWKNRTFHAKIEHKDFHFHFYINKFFDINKNQVLAFFLYKANYENSNFLIVFGANIHHRIRIEWTYLHWTICLFYTYYMLISRLSPETESFAFLYVLFWNITEWESLLILKGHCSRYEYLIYLSIIE